MLTNTIFRMISMMQQLSSSQLDRLLTIISLIQNVTNVDRIISYHLNWRGIRNYDMEREPRILSAEEIKPEPVEAVECDICGLDFTTLHI